MDFRGSGDYTNQFQRFLLLQFKDDYYNNIYTHDQQLNSRFEKIILIFVQLVITGALIVCLAINTDDNIRNSILISILCLFLAFYIAMMVFSYNAVTHQARSRIFYILCLSILVFYATVMEGLYIPNRKLGLDSQQDNIIENTSFIIFCSKIVEFLFLMLENRGIKFIFKALVYLHFFIRSDILEGNLNVHYYCLILLLIISELNIQKKIRMTFFQFQKERKQKENYKEILQDKINSSILILKRKPISNPIEKTVETSKPALIQNSVAKSKFATSRFADTLDSMEKQTEKASFMLSFMNQQFQEEFQINNDSDIEQLFLQFQMEEKVNNYQGKEKSYGFQKSPQSRKNQMTSIIGYSESFQNLFSLLSSFFKNIEQMIRLPQGSPVNQKIKNIQKEFIFNYSGENDTKTIYNIEMSSIQWNEQVYCLLILQNIDQQIMLKKQGDITKFKDQMIHSITHNLKTPLNCIMLQIKSSKMIHDFDKIQKNINTMNLHSQLLLSQIDDVIDYSRISNDSLVLNLEYFNLNRLIEEVQTMCSVHLRPSVIIIVKMHIQENDLILYNDIQRVRQILISLLGNSIQYTYSGRIFITAQRFRENEIRVTVDDSGIGMVQDKLNLLNELLKERETIEDALNLLAPLEIQSSEDFSSGSGLGLLITKKLISRVGPGIMLINSTPRKGTKVSFEIFARNQNFKSFIDPNDISIQNPYGSEEQIDFVNESMVSVEPIKQLNANSINSANNRSSGNDKSIEQEIDQLMDNMEENKNNDFHFVQMALTQSRRSSLKLIQVDESNAEIIIKEELSKKQNILIVDDTQFNIEALKQLLWQFNEELKIDEVYDGQSAIEIVREKTNFEKTKNFQSFYDLIFMDVNMPILDGFQATQAIRNEFGPFVFVIIVTAYSDEDDIQQSIESGADFHLSKPLSLIQLAKALKKKKNYQDSPGQMVKVDSPLLLQKQSMKSLFKRSPSRNSKEIQVSLEQIN